MSGIIGLYNCKGKGIAESLFYGLTALQHRGEEGWGVAVARKRILTRKSKGLIFYFLKDELPLLEATNSYAGIGHALYERTGNPQPIEASKERYSLALAMDGVILGFEMKNDILLRDLLLQHLEETGDIPAAAGRLMDNLDGRGSYNLVAIVKDNQTEELVLVGLRDPKGIKPLCLGSSGDTYIISSESKSLDGVGARLEGDVTPGEVILVGRNGLFRQKLRDKKHAHCAFEWIYFADPTSTIEGKNVYAVRKALGKALAHKYPIDADVVIASPDSGRGVALGYAQASGKPFEEAVIKNPGARRTFQVEDPEERRRAARSKFYISRDVIKDKKVILGDDSIVRGTVIRDGMINKLREYGARKIHLVISSPALCYPCFKDPRGKNYAAFGLKDMPSEEIGKLVAKKLGADSVSYPSIEIMEEIIGRKDLCKACMDGVYPVDEEYL